MEIVVFANSTGWYAHDGQPHHYNDSYIHILSKNHKVTGYWNSGMTALHFRKMIKGIVKPYRPVIIQIGCCEAVTRPAPVFLQKAIDYLCHFTPDPFFDFLIVPKMEKAIDEIAKGEQTFYRFIDPDDFLKLCILGSRALTGWQGIFIGMPKPFNENEMRTTQLAEYNGLIECVARSTDNFYINMWDVTGGDGTHFTKQGHQVVYERIMTVINERYIE